MQRIREFVLAHVARETLRDDEDIFSLGLVNSMFIVQLVSFVEKEFDVTILGADLDFDHFRSVAAMGHLVDRLAAARAR